MLPNPAIGATEPAKNKPGERGFASHLAQQSTTARIPQSTVREQTRRKRIRLSPCHPRDDTADASIRGSGNNAGERGFASLLASHATIPRIPLSAI